MNFYNKFNDLKMKYKLNPGKLVVPIVGLFALICLGVGTSYAYLNYFSEATNTTGISAGTLALEFSGETSAIVLDKGIPQTNADALANNTAYSFSIKNTGTLPVAYTLSFNDICSTTASYTVGGSSVTPNKCIPFTYINVAIKKGTADYVTYNLADYAASKTAVLDLGEIAGGATSEAFSLKVWLDQSTPNEYSSEPTSGTTQNVIFAGRVSVYGEQVTSTATPAVLRMAQNKSCFIAKDGTITGYDVSCGLNVNIPSMIDGVIINAIGDNAFLNKNIKSLTLPVALTSIGENSFKGNDLSCVTIPNTVTSIGKGAFYKSSTSNTGLTGISNNTTNQFYWDKIINGKDTSDYHFINGTVANDVSSVIISSGDSCSSENLIDPVFENISMISNNSNQTYAKAGDVITVDIITKDPISTPKVFVAGASATVKKVSDTRYSATVSVTDSFVNGEAKLVISDWKYEDGTDGSVVSKTTTDSYVNIDTKKVSCTASGPFDSTSTSNKLTKVSRGSKVYFALSCTDVGGIKTVKDATTLTLGAGISSIDMIGFEQITNGYKYIYEATVGNTAGNYSITFPDNWVLDVAGNGNSSTSTQNFTVE